MLRDRGVRGREEAEKTKSGDGIAEMEINDVATGGVELGVDQKYLRWR